MKKKSVIEKCCNSPLKTVGGNMEKLELTKEEFYEISWALFLCETLVEQDVSKADKLGWEANLPREWLAKIKRAIRLLHGDRQ